MNSLTAKFITSCAAFIVGALIVINAVTAVETLWLLIPGCLLLLLSYPAMHVLYDRIHRGYRGSREQEQEALDEARAGLKAKGVIDDKE